MTSDARVTLNADGLTVDGDFVPLISGQFEFWRHNPLHWERLLGLIRGAGLKMVGTFVCWEHHDLGGGEFDFTGATSPSRDLAGWLDLCHDHGLHVLLRVGPIIDAGWWTHGPPADLCTKERLDPEFLTATRRYLEALGEVAVPRQLQSGGPIVAVCLDNEIFFPYRDEEPTIGSIPVPYDEQTVLAGFRAWLSQRNPSIAQLNASWGTELPDFDQVGTPDYRAASQAQILDSFGYITAAIREYFRILSEMCSSVGFSLPTFVNTRPHTEYIDWVQIEDVVDSQGINAYAGVMLPGEQATVAHWYYRLQDARRRLFWAPEFQSGETMGDLGSTFEVQTPDHFRYFNHFAMALGLRGLNWYMFIERDDWLWCPVNPVGKLRPQYEIARDHVRILQRLRPDAQMADTALLWFLEHNQRFIAEGFRDWTELQETWTDLDGPKEFPPWWSAFRSLLDADADFVLADPRATTEGLPKYLIYAGPDFVRPCDWELIVVAVEAGATLINVTKLPERNLSAMPDERLAALNSRLLASGRLLTGSPATAEAASRSAGARNYVTTSPAGLWSSARQRGASWTISIINPGESPVDATLNLATEICSADSSVRLSALVSNTVLHDGGDLPASLSIHLDAKSVELLLIEPTGSDADTEPKTVEVPAKKAAPSERARQEARHSK